MPARKWTEQYNAKRESMKDYKYFFYQYSESFFYQYSFINTFMSLLDKHQLKIVTKVQITI